MLSANVQRAEEAAYASCSLSEQADNGKKILDSLVALVDGADAVRSYVRSQPVMQRTGSRYIAPAKSEQRSQSSSARRKIGSAPKMQIDSKVQSPEDIFPLNDFYQK